MSMNPVTAEIVKQVLEHWTDFSYRAIEDNAIDPGQVVARTGVSRTTAYQIKARAEFLRKEEIRNGSPGNTIGKRPNGNSDSD